MQTPARPDRRAAVARVALAAVAVLAPGLEAAAAGFDLAALTVLLGRVTSGEATFTESRRIEMLDRTLQSSGRLSFRAPDLFVRETLRPRREKLAVNGNTLTMSLGERSRTMQLDASPEAAVIVEAVRGTLTGNRESLERLFDAAVSGSADAWTLELVPKDARLRGQVAQVRVSGRASVVREVQVLLADGDRSVMTITPITPVAAGRGPG
jgi:outer membrane lipoprotein-sorting protein